VKLVDVNLLLHAANSDSPHHRAARGWLEGALSDEEPVGLAWVVVLGFLRVSTNPLVFERPLTPDQAMEVVAGWLSLPNVRRIAPGDEHWRILHSLLKECGTAANLTTDAHLAALAIEHWCELHSTDSDFGRFRHLRWRNPLAADWSGK
jgi:toxin-antitoxin system PIN domain toxin